MRKHPTAIVLGGTSPHIALIENLKTRGYYTVLVDYLENPPARNAADEHIRESTLDQDKVLELARTIDARLVISTCVDQANVTACYVAERLGLPAPYSYETALNVTNKILMKKMMIESDIPTSRFRSISSEISSENIDLSFPVVVKPADATGSKGVTRVDSNADLSICIAKALRNSRSGFAIVEEFVEGTEVQVDCFVQDGLATIIMVREKVKAKQMNGVVLQSVGSLVPAGISDNALSNIQRIANEIAIKFGLVNTSMFIQAIVNGDSVTVIEFAARIGGGLSYRMIEVISGFDVVNSAINSYFKQKSDLSFRRAKSNYATILVYTFPGVLCEIVGQDELLKKGIIQEFYRLKANGSIIGPDIASKNRVAALLLNADSRQALVNRMEQVMKHLEVYDESGKPILRRDLYALGNNQ